MEDDKSTTPGNIPVLAEPDLVEIIMPHGMAGGNTEHDLLEAGLRAIAVAASEDSRAEWAEKYGTNFKNETFMMHKYCYSADTEVLTERGFVYFHELNDNDLFLSLNPTTMYLEYLGAQNIISFDYQGIMKNIKGRSINLLVTPEHKMFVLDYKKRPVFKDINELRCKDAFTTKCVWVGKAGHIINIGSYSLSDIDYARFMGYYLSEGSTVKRGPKWFQTSIGQSNVANRKTIASDLERMGIPITSNKWQINIRARDAGFGQHLLRFGKAHEKFIPKIIKEMSVNLIDVFLSAYELGDGTRVKIKPFKDGNFRDEVRYYTSSKRMADDLCELLLKTGKRPTVSVIAKAGQKTKFANGVYARNHDGYAINARYHTQTFVQNVSISDIEYQGKVYDVSLIRNHTLLIRRDGKIWWGSNCWCEKEDCPWCSGSEPHFLFKPTGFSIDWYKFIGRDMQLSGPVSAFDIVVMILHCLVSVYYMENEKVLRTWRCSKCGAEHKLAVIPLKKLIDATWTHPKCGGHWEIVEQIKMPMDGEDKTEN